MDEHPISPAVPPSDSPPRDPASAELPESELAEDAPPTKPVRGWSALPLAASLALVAFAVLFGIYGPRVADRSNPPLGIPVWELAHAATDRHRERVRLAETSGERAIERETALEALADVLGRSADLPDLSTLGFEPYEVRPVSLPGGGRAALLLYGTTQRSRRSFLSLALVPDREQYVIFTPFGKPMILPTDEGFPVDAAEGGFSRPPSIIWSDGDLVHVLHTLDDAALDEAGALLLGDSVAPSR